jgi:hypothetical protein
MKLKPDWKHIVAFLLAVTALVATYASGAVSSGTPITVVSAWSALGASIWLLFQKNILQPDTPPGQPMTKFALHNSDRPVPPATSFVVGWVVACAGILVCAVLISTLPSCAAAKSIIDLANAECVDLGKDPNEPAFEKFACDVIDATGIVVQTFNVRVGAEEAPAFAAKHAVKAGHPTPHGE